MCLPLGDVHDDVPRTTKNHRRASGVIPRSWHPEAPTERGAVIVKGNNDNSIRLRAVTKSNCRMSGAKRIQSCPMLSQPLHSWGQLCAGITECQKIERKKHET